MPLLTPRDTIAAAYCMPDAVAFQFCYGMPAQTQAYTLRNALRPLVEDPKIGLGMSLHFQLRVPGIARPVKVKFTKPGANTPAYFKVWVSVLRDLRTRGLLNERPRNGQENFLAANQVSADNRWVAERVTEYLSLIEPVLGELADRVARNLPSGGFSRLLEVRLHALEVCADIVHRDPGFVVEQSVGRFAAYCSNVLVSQYRQTAATYRGVSQNSLMASGFQNSGKRFKAYVKTNTRVRLECSLDKRALLTILGDRRLDAFSFGDMFTRVASDVAPTFNQLVGGVPVPRGECRSPLELVALAFRDIPIAQAESDLLTLMRNGRLQTGGERETVRRLEGRGIIIRTGRGLYAIAPAFAAALAGLRDTMDAWTIFQQGAAR